MWLKEKKKPSYTKVILACYEGHLGKSWLKFIFAPSDWDRMTRLKAGSSHYKKPFHEMAILSFSVELCNVCSNMEIFSKITSWLEVFFQRQYWKYLGKRVSCGDFPSFWTFLSNEMIQSNNVIVGIRIARRSFVGDRSTNCVISPFDWLR